MRCVDLAWFLPLMVMKACLCCGRQIMRVIGKSFSLGLLTMIITSCSLSSTPALGPDPEIFRVGDLEVRLYSSRERMIRSLPPIFALLAATRVGNSQIQISGYYDRENKRIYAINDARTVIHEFKHYLEPDWKHGEESAHQDHRPRLPISTPAIVPAWSPIAQAHSKEPLSEIESDL